jgi:hypothetical protein
MSVVTMMGKTIKISKGKNCLTLKNLYKNVIYYQGLGWAKSYKYAKVATRLL